MQGHRAHGPDLLASLVGRDNSSSNTHASLVGPPIYIRDEQLLSVFIQAIHQMVDSAIHRLPVEELGSEPKQLGAGVSELKWNIHTVIVCQE